MKCTHCSAKMPDKGVICPACGKHEAPEGFALDEASGLYKIMAQGTDSETGEPISIVTWFDPATGKYVQDVTTAEKQPDREAQPEPRAQPDIQLKPGTYAKQAEPFHPEIEYKPKLPIKKKKHAGLAVLLVLLAVAGLAVAGLAVAGSYYLGSNFGQTLDFLQNQLVTEDVTTPPPGADIPAFAPVEPTAPVMEAPEEMEEPGGGEEDDLPEPQEQERIPLQVSRVNYYNDFAVVNPFYTRAAQDQNYVWFLPAGDIHPFTQLNDLMCADPDRPEPLPAPNLWPGSGSIYSFVLYNDGIVVCAKRPDIEGYGFYRADKAGIDEPKLLFERNEPAYMRVYNGAVYALFPNGKQLVEFHPESGGPPRTTNMPIEALNGLFAEYLPDFSIVDGYIYYGLSYRNGQNVEYERRSLETAEKISAFSPSTLGETWTVHPVWDTDGNVYYGRYDYDAGTYFVKTAKPDGVVLEIARFGIRRGIPSFLAGVGFKSLVAEIDERLYARKSFGTLDREHESMLASRPYAATRDYLVADDGLYRLSDFGFIAFEQGNDAGPSGPDGI